MTMTDEQYAVAQRAQQLLQDDVLLGMFTAAEVAIINEWKKATETKVREYCWHQLQALDLVKRALRIASEAKDIQDAENASEQANS